MSSPSASFVLAPGAVPLPDYELKVLLGRGGFGEVWRATGPGGFDMAIKFVRLEGKAGDVERRALETIKGLRHAHLLPVFGAWERHDWLIVAMELGDKTLMDRLNECQAAKQRGIPREELLGYMRDAARGLDYLAEARPGADGKMTFLQHRDIKPQNLIIIGGTVKVADFGLIKVLKHSATQASSKMTPAYAPPELFKDKLTRSSDQYSLAVSYCLLRGGKMPFGGTNLMQLMNDHLYKAPDLSMLPEEERPTVAQALEKKPKRRWPSCLAFADALADLSQPPNAVEMPLRLQKPPNSSSEGEAMHSMIHDPIPPASEPTPRMRRAIPWRTWLGIVGLQLVAALILVAPHIVRSWRGNQTLPSIAEKSELEPKELPPLGGDGKQELPPLELGPLGMKFVHLPKGTFYMGWDGPDKPGKKTNIMEDFDIAIHTVTQEQWTALMEDEAKNPSKFRRGGEYANYVESIPDEILKHFPVENVSWKMVQGFIQKLNEQEFKRGGKLWYRLPTEAEWEYACRGGATSQAECSFHFYFDKPTNALSFDQANFDGRAQFNTGKQANDYPGRPVSTVDSNRYKPNKLGLYHMHGNVWQWCEDLYEEGGSDLVIRGGSFLSDGQRCRAAFRFGNEPSYRSHDLGFRLVRVARGEAIRVPL